MKRFFVNQLVIAALCVSAAFMSCNKNDDLPPVLNATVIGVTSTTAILGGDITYMGASAITERGVVYSTMQNPSIAENKTVVRSAGIDNLFSVNVSNLTAFTTYYVQAYVVNAAGTTYSSEISFRTNGILPAIIIDERGSHITAASASICMIITNAGLPEFNKVDFVLSRWIGDQPGVFGTATTFDITNTVRDNHVNARINDLREDSWYTAKASITNSSGMTYAEFTFKTPKSGN